MWMVLVYTISQKITSCILGSLRQKSPPGAAPRESPPDTAVSGGPQAVYLAFGRARAYSGPQSLYSLLRSIQQVIAGGLAGLPGAGRFAHVGPAGQRAAGDGVRRSVLAVIDGRIAVHRDGGG